MRGEQFAGVPTAEPMKAEFRVEMSDDHGRFDVVVSARHRADAIRQAKWLAPGATIRKQPQRIK